MTIRHLAYRIGHEFKGSVAGLASLMGKGETVLSNKLNPNSETHYLNVHEFEMMVDFAGRNFDVADYFAQKCNAVVVQMPDLGESDMALLDGFMNITKELGDVGLKFQQAYADGDIDAKDVKVMKKEIKEVVSALLAFESRIVGMQHGG